MKVNLSLGHILFGFILILQMLASCNFRNADNGKDLNLSFEYSAEGGRGILQMWKVQEEIIRTRDHQDTIEISVYKWLGVPIEGYNGRGEMKSDTLYLYFWEEMKEANRDHAHAALMLETLLKYKIRKTRYTHIKVKQLLPNYKK